MLRNHEGAIIFASCRFIPVCYSALEAEIATCKEGIVLALEWCDLPAKMELGCVTAVNLLKSLAQDRPPLAAMVGETKRLLCSGREFLLSHVYHEQNLVSHALDQMGRSLLRTAVWLRADPDEIGNHCQLDCMDDP